MPERETLRNGRKKAVIEALKRGWTRSAACEKAGITRETFYRWIREDVTLYDSVIRAEAEAEGYFTDQIKNAAGEDWRAAESWLKRRRREDWGDRLDVKQLDSDTIIRLLERDAALRAAAGSGEAAPAVLGEPGADAGPGGSSEP